MKKAIYILVLIILPITGYSQKQIFTDSVFYDYPYHKQLHIEYSYYKKGRQKINHGVFKEYDKEGKLERYITFDGGKRQGKYFEYYKNEEVFLESNYINDTCFEYYKYYDNGELMISADCKTDSIKKFGFPNGNYALTIKRGDKIFYNVYNSSENFLYTTLDTVKHIFKSPNHIEYQEYKDFSCKKIITYELEYPEKTVLLAKEGLVIYKVQYNSYGEIIDMKPIDFFDDLAMEKNLRNLKNHKGFKNLSGDNIISQEFYTVFKFMLID